MRHGPPRSTRLSLVPCPWLAGRTQASARLLDPFPTAMRFAVICFGNQSLGIVGFIWKAGPAPLHKGNGPGHGGVALASLAPSDTNTHRVLPSMDMRMPPRPSDLGG